ncbi:MAG: NUDIX domain-containing protein [Candidatus Thorarchaeota archaeon]
MPKLIPIAISILRCDDRYLFLKRRNPPYENLWSMIGGKINIGEHIVAAAIREVMEETGTRKVDSYECRGIVSERLVQADDTLSLHFLIFVGYAEISDYRENHREGELALFSLEEVNRLSDQFLPSDLRMFNSYRTTTDSPLLYEAELVHENGRYTLGYYRKARD